MGTLLGTNSPTNCKNFPISREYATKVNDAISSAVNDTIFSSFIAVISYVVFDADLYNNYTADTDDEVKTPSSVIDKLSYAVVGADLCYNNNADANNELTSTAMLLSQ